MDKHALRGKIIAAAVKIFTKKGFFETTVDDIARSSGVAKGTVYLYFKDKPALYLGVIDRHFTLARESLDRVEALKISNSKKLVRIADEWLAYMFKFKHEFPMFGMENVNLTRRVMKGIDPVLLVGLHSIVEPITRIIRAGIAGGEFRRVDPALASIYFLNVLRTAFMIRNLPMKFKKSNQGVMDMFVLGLKKEKR